MDPKDQGRGRQIKAVNIFFPTNNNKVFVFQAQPPHGSALSSLFVGISAEPSVA